MTVLKLRPQASTRLLLVAPHPDDETLAGAALMQAVQAVGGCVQIWLLTDGEANPWPQRWIERRCWINPAARRRWGRRRRAEMQAALAVLGLSSVEVLPLGWPDLGVSAKLLDDGMAVVEDLATRLAAFAPTHLLCPDLSDRHPDHSATHVLLQLALARLPRPWPQVLTYGLHGATPQARTWQLDSIPAADLERKRQAVECYQTQLCLGGARMRRWGAQSEQYFEPMPPVAADDGLPLPWRPRGCTRYYGIKLIAVDALGAVVWPWARAPLVRRVSGDYALQRHDRAWAAGPCYIKWVPAWTGPWIFDLWTWHRLPATGSDQR